MRQVTVITAVLNLIQNDRVDCFRKCMESVHMQDYPNIEHLIIDGASTDGTRELIAEYEKKGWVKCYSQKDTGIYDAFNKGIHFSKGDYINFMNSDDAFACADAISSLVGGLEKENADYVYGDAHIFETTKPDWIFNDNLDKFWDRMPFSHQTLIVKKSLFEQEGLFSTNYRLASDYDWILNLIFKNYKPAYVPKVVVNFRADGASIQMMELSHAECADIYLNRYRAFYPKLTPEEARSIVELWGAPPAFIKALRNRMASQKPHVLPLKRMYEYMDIQLKEAERKKNAPQKKKQFYSIPLIKYKSNIHKTSLSVLGINVFKIVRKKHKCRVLLFHFLPIWQVKRQGKESEYYFLKYLLLFKSVRDS